MTTPNRFGFGSVTSQQNQRQIRVWHPIRNKFREKEEVIQFLANQTPPQQLKQQYFCLTVGPTSNNNHSATMADIIDSHEVMVPYTTVGLTNMRVGLIQNIFSSTAQPNQPDLWVTMRLFDQYPHQTNQLEDGSTTQYVFNSYEMHVIRADLVQDCVYVARTPANYNFFEAKPNQRKIVCPFVEVSPGNTIAMNYHHSPERWEAKRYRNISHLQKSQRLSWQRMMDENARIIEMKAQEISAKNIEIAEMEKKMRLKQQIINRKKDKIKQLRHEQRVLLKQRDVTEVEHMKEITGYESANHTLLQKLRELDQNARILPKVTGASSRSNNKLVLHIGNKRSSVTVLYFFHFFSYFVSSYSAQTKEGKSQQ